MQNETIRELIEDLNRYKKLAKYWGKIAFDKKNELNRNGDNMYDTINDLQIIGYRRGEGETSETANVKPIHLYLFAKWKIKKIQKRLNRERCKKF